MIPCFLTISSEDETVVQIISSQKAPTLRLLRCIQHPIVGENTKLKPEQGFGLGMFGAYQTVIQVGAMNVPTGQMTSVYHEVGRAQWWVPPESVIQHPNVRHLEGEIHLSQSLHPTCDFRFFQVQVCSFRFNDRTTNLFSLVLC